MAKSAIPVQILAIVGAATLLAGVHSLIVPVTLTREKTGFVVPAGAQQPADQSTGSTAEAPAPSAADPAAVEDAQAQTGDGVGLDASASSGDGKISLAEATKLHELAITGQGVWFLDARRRVDYDAGRIEGALYMEHTHISSGEGLDELMMFSPPEMGELLVIYCTGGDCQASEDTAILLQQAGYTNIAIMAAGFDEWAAAGRPTSGPTGGP